MLVTLKHILQIAEERNIAVGSFNTANEETIEAVVEGAEELGVPVIIQFAEGQQRHIKIEYIAPIMLDFAKRAKVPVCVHLDHGNTLECVAKAVDLGFTSVMYDGSELPYEQNIENTLIARKLSDKTGASLEAELGSMGKRESGTGDTDGPDPTKIYTDPELAADFVARTRLDALACSFGTTHGIYLTEPKLDFDVVRNVRKNTNNIPVVMHGGSGVSPADYRKAVEAGVRKINYATYMNKAGGEAVKKAVEEWDPTKPIFFAVLSNIGRDAEKADAMAAMKVFAGIDD